MRPLLACLLLILALPISAQIYKYTDAKGNVVFSQQAPEGVKSEIVELQHTNTIPAVPTRQPQASAKPSHSGQPYQILELIDLPTEAALRDNDGNFSVTVRIEPTLRPEHQLRLLIDGKAHGQGSQNTALTVTELDRGEHRLAVEVIAGGKGIQKSSERTITVQRTSVHSPARRK